MATTGVCSALRHNSSPPAQIGNHVPNDEKKQLDAPDPPHGRRRRGTS